MAPGAEQCGGTIGLPFLYYRNPEIYDMVPLSGPTLGSGALGMSQATFVVTLHGRGFDRLAARSSEPSRRRSTTASATTRWCS